MKIDYIINKIIKDLTIASLDYKAYKFMNDKKQFNNKPWRNIDNN